MAHTLHQLRHTALHKATRIFLNVLENIPEICYAGDPVLRHPTTEVTLDEGRTIGDQLGEILLRYRKIAGIGRGLAAPQIGINRSVFVTFVEDQLHTYINPTVVAHSEKTCWYKELCLSCGLVAGDVERHQSITLQWTDEEGVMKTKHFEGFMARLLQHEEAHLRGVLNIDEATPQGIECLTFDPLQEKIRTI